MNCGKEMRTCNGNVSTKWLQVTATQDTDCTDWFILTSGGINLDPLIYFDSDTSLMYFRRAFRLIVSSNNNKDMGSFHTGPCRNGLKWRIMIRVTSDP